MSNKEIKSECELIYKSIETSRDRLIELRKLCNHENTLETNYSYRVASSLPAIVCTDCGELIEYLGLEFNP